MKDVKGVLSPLAEEFEAKENGTFVIKSRSENLIAEIVKTLDSDIKVFNFLDQEGLKTVHFGFNVDSANPERSGLKWAQIA